VSPFMVLLSGKGLALAGELHGGGCGYFPTTSPAFFRSGGFGDISYLHPPILY